MVEIIEVRLGLTWLVTVSEVVVLTATAVWPPGPEEVIVVVIGAYEVQTPEPQTCPPRQQPPNPIVSFSIRVSRTELTHLPDLKGRRTTLGHRVLWRW
jgi:hypothetical protein